LKVGVFLVDKMPPTEGGGFSYYDRLVNAIDEHNFNSQLEICFIGRIPSTRIRLKKKYHKIAPHFLYRIFHILKELKILPFLSRITSLNLDLSNKIDVKRLERNKVDILLYPKQAYMEVEHFPFISMNWDIGHKSTYAFPEFMDNGNFRYRELWYKEKLQKAFVVFAESEHGKRELTQFCQIPEKKIEIVPMFPGRVVDLNVGEDQQQGYLQGFSLQAFSFFYYPAQYWAHKNHYNLLVAFRKLTEQKGQENLKLVFTGSDHGNKEYIASVVREMHLDNKVLMLDFVSLEEVYTLYKKSIALVMPTFLGPTNMPLAEAQALGTAVICTDFDGHREMCHDGAIYIDPHQADSIFVAMNSVTDPAARAHLIERANKVVRNSSFTIQNAVLKLDEALTKIKSVRNTFGR
jgi:glycosyltransferase involved in cell wall biosynthesis